LSHKLVALAPFFETADGRGNKGLTLSEIEHPFGAIAKDEILSFSTFLLMIASTYP
jgi:hypothetical protein